MKEPFLSRIRCDVAGGKHWRRVHTINHDDLQWVIGMNRIRSAYLDLHPELEKYFVSSRYDDWPGITASAWVRRRTADKWKRGRAIAKVGSEGPSSHANSDYGRDMSSAHTNRP